MAGKKYYIYLFRHGQTTYNRDGRFTGFHNPGLTNLGIKQARTVARKLKNKKFKIAYETRLRRSKQTLNEVLKYHPECRRIIIDDRMIERNYGKLNGKTHDDFIRRIGSRLINLEMEGDAIENLSPEKRKEAERFLGANEYNLIHRGFKMAPPRGESFSMVERRVKPFIRDLIKLIKKNKCNVAISAHGNSIRLFRRIMEHSSVKQTCSWFIPYDKVFVYSVKT